MGYKITRTLNAKEGGDDDDIECNDFVKIL
jgi:hypothetical protein